MNKRLPLLSSGFTLIEILIAIAILIVMIGVVVLTFPSAQATARDGRRRSDLKQYQTVLETFANRSNSLYPARPGGDNPLNLCTTLGVTQGCVNDPQSPTRQYNYRSNGSGTNINATQYVLWATLEKNNNNQAQLWVVCSNGQAGRINANPLPNFASGACPANLQP